MVNPSKWQAVKKGASWQIQTKDSKTVAVIENGTEAEANAKLIAASPHLLEALKAMVDLIGDEDLPDNGELSGAAICDMARSAITLVE
jgi:hypothetical protein